MATQPILPESQKDSGHVQRQVRLPFLKSVEISLKSIKVRFFRSAITTMSLVLAVSFLSFASVNTDAANGLLQDTIDEGEATTYIWEASDPTASR